MEENITRRKIWDQAGVAGLILGMILAIAMLLNGLILNSQMSAGASSITSLLVSLFRIGGYIVAMAYFMGLFSGLNPQATQSEIFRFGRAAAILAALINAAAGFADAAYLNQELYVNQYEAILEMFNPMMGSDFNTTSGWMLRHVPHLTFFSCLPNAAILGSVLAFILSRKIQVSRNGNDL